MGLCWNIGCAHITPTGYCNLTACKFPQLHWGSTSNSSIQPFGTWERMENAYGELEGFMCTCGRQSNEASNYCPNCGRKMSDGERIIMKNIKFISYNGRYPNLCSGTLKLYIDGVKHEFEDALKSGGSVWFDSDWDEHIEYGEWSVSIDGLSKNEIERITELVNQNVPQGCCGGCI